MARAETSDQDLEASREAARRQREAQKLSQTFTMPQLPTASGEQTVSHEQIGFFKEHGFLILERLIDEDAINAAMSRIWDYVEVRIPGASESSVLRRDDPTTWRQPAFGKQPPQPKTGYYQGRVPVEYFDRTIKLHDIGTEDFLLDLLPRHPCVEAIAKRMLGPNLRPSNVTRGVYALLPGPKGRSAKGSMLGPHTDQVCQQLNTCAYLNDVEPRGGGFTVYPGSHRIMFQAHETEANFSPNAYFREHMRKVVNTIEPYELCAPKGSVIFWHGRTVHSPGIHLGDNIRWALFGDYSLDHPVLDDDEHRACGQYEWFKNTRLFREDHFITEDMWRGWSI